MLLSLHLTTRSSPSCYRNAGRDTTQTTDVMHLLCTVSSYCRPMTLCHTLPKTVCLHKTCGRFSLV